MSSNKKNIITSPEKQWVIDVVSRKKPVLSSQLETSKIVSEALRNGMGALTYQYINDDNIECNDGMKLQFKKSAYHTLIQNTRIKHVWDELLKLCADNNFETLPLKGIFLSQYIYSDMVLRPMSDIDILLNPEEAEELYIQLIGLGAKTSDPDYIRKRTTTDHHLPGLTYKGVYIELHRSLMSLDATYKLSNELIWNNTISYKGTDTIEPNINLIYFSLHLYYTTLRGGIRLSWLYDLMIFAESEHFTKSEGNFIKTLKALKMEAPIIGILKAAEDIFDYEFTFADTSNLNSKNKSIYKRILFLVNNEESVSGTDYSYELALERLKNTKGLNNKWQFIKERVFNKNGNIDTFKRITLVSSRMLGMVKQKLRNMLRF